MKFFENQVVLMKTADFEYLMFTNAALGSLKKIIFTHK